MNDLRAAYWEELARREPYFRLLAHDGAVETAGNRDATAAFFETGEADVTALLGAIASLLGRPLSLTSTLDLGCGAGRLTLPLARRSRRVIACDIAPTMLAHARRNAEDARLDNITFLSSGQLDTLQPGAFDFICSLLVLQYIPPAAGAEILATLLRALMPGGIAALQLTFTPTTRSPLRNTLATMARLRPSRRLAQRQNAADRFTEINKYDRQAVLDTIDAAGARCIGQFAADQGSTSGAVLIVEKI